jgi:sigma-B regulation protein RsbU (phosphoserine phosphatase)
MIGIVSHDLRNPLNAIRIGTGMLEMAGLPEDQERVVALINRATTRASDLISDLLDFTRARVGSGLAVDVGPIHLHEVVAEALDELRLAHPARSLIHQRLGDARATADPRRIAQLLGNLVANAVAYGAPDAPITVSTQTGATSVVSVHNLGPPIPPALQASMFEPMTRGEGHTSSSRSVGLGLYIVREIARAHGGTATVTSADPGGTTFRIEW